MEKTIRDDDGGVGNDWLLVEVDGVPTSVELIGFTAASQPARLPAWLLPSALAVLAALWRLRR